MWGIARPFHLNFFLVSSHPPSWMLKFSVLHWKVINTLFYKFDINFKKIFDTVQEIQGDDLCPHCMMNAKEKSKLKLFINFRVQLKIIYIRQLIKKFHTLFQSLCFTKIHRRIASVIQIILIPERSRPIQFRHC